MDSPTSAAAPSAQEKTSRIVSEYLKGKDEQWRALYERKRPLTLLELPIDILQLIVKEITLTNDLTALARTNSALYSLAVPVIYSRFDIVWPDGPIGSTESKSVDALTYGLSTLCLGSSFARTVRRAWHANDRRAAAKLIDTEYAKYTKKFSLGNGPSNWVAEYLISKESGKMLGTLAANAIYKMKNLETFVWDMPTGVLSDVFEALASLADQPDSECKLSRVWVRWHDNSELVSPGLGNPHDIVNGTALVPQGSQLTPVGIMLPANAGHPPPRAPISYSEYHCQYPTFSVLPRLKSLTVLDIDEIGYLDEIAVLIERSKDSLQELRVGISAKAANKAFAQTWDGPGLKQIDHRARWPGQSTIGDRRLGGVLGILVGKIYDIRKRKAKDKPAPDASVTNGNSSPDAPVPKTAQSDGHAAPWPSVDGEETQQPQGGNGTPAGAQHQSKGLRPSKPGAGGHRKRLEGKLRLHTLELERVVLSLQVCRYAIDWTVLTNLTLLDCAQHDNFWKMLRKQFQPTPLGAGFGISSCNKPANAPLQYHLALKAIHTDTTTLSLIAFVKETLAPNSLEVLFLQDRKRATPILLETIFKGAIKRHSASLRKLLLDSSARPSGDNTRWRHWALTKEVLRYITSGRMVNLRELAVSLEYRDWHEFLQRLPNMPELRSLNIPHIRDYPKGGFDPRDLAHQIVDIITLRPEIRLCYVGIGAKCFEILECKDTGQGGGDDPVLIAVTSPGLSPAAVVYSAGVDDGEMTDTLGLDPDDPDDDDDDDDDDDEHTSDEEDAVGGNGNGGIGNGADVDDDDGDDGDADENEGNTPTTGTSDPGGTQSGDDEDVAAAPSAPAGPVAVAVAVVEEVGDSDDEEDEEDDDGFVEPGRGGVQLKLREILFYDDKVAIFRARHGKL